MSFRDFLKKYKERKQAKDEISEDEITEDGEGSVGSVGTSSSCIAPFPGRLGIGDSAETIRRSFYDALRDYPVPTINESDSETSQYIDWSIFEAVLSVCSSVCPVPYKDDISGILKTVQKDKDPWKRLGSSRKIDLESAKLKDELLKIIRETEKNLQKL